MAASLFGVSTSSLRLDFSIASYSSSSSSSACRRPRRTGARCSLMSSSERERESLGKDRTAEMEFKMSDFAVSNHVSTGLQGRADEVIFEATVKNSESPLYNSRVVLRELTSVQAQRRGRRALEVLKKLERRQLMYHSYAMQVHGYVSASSNGESRSFMLVHGYHGSYSLRHWLQLSDWLPTLEATLALDDEWARRVGDGTIGGPAVTRQLRLTRILMRDLLIGVNYLHSHGLAHTELRLENVHISPVDKHVKVGILGNAVDLYGSSARGSTVDGNTVRKTLMIAFDMRCVGFIMAKMVLRELMDTAEFMKFKSFLTKGNDPSCLREFLLPILSRQSPSGNAGLQMLDRNWGAGWNLLCLLLATKPSERISCLDALRHPFLCGPKWRVDSSMNIIRWGLGSTTVRMAEDYIYGRQQRTRISYFIELMELLNPNPRRKNWLDFLPGKWRILYSTGRHIGLTLRQPSLRVLILSAHLTFIPSLNSSTPTTFSLVSHVTFTVMPLSNWPHNKSGIHGTLHITTLVRVAPGRRLYLQDSNNESIAWKVSSQKLKEKAGGTMKEPPFGLPALKFVGGEVDVEMTLDPPSSDLDEAGRILKEVRTQIPPEMFDVVKIVCGTYIDSRLMVLRGVNGSALLFTRSCS